MTTKICKHCKKEVDSKATRCSYCQGDLRSWFAKHPILTAILILFVIGMISSVGGKKGTTTTKTTGNTTSKVTDNTQPEVKPTSVSIIVEAKALVEEYDKNKLSAQEKYTGKIIQTTAVIKNISGGGIGDYYLSLDPSNEQYYFGTTIQCLFKDKGELTSLAKGQTVTVAGTMKDMSIGTVLMKDCNLVK